MALYWTHGGHLSSFDREVPIGQVRDLYRQCTLCLILKRLPDQYDLLKYWHFVYGEANQIHDLFNSLRHEITLDENLASSHVFIIDKERNQRGRLDNREDKEIEKNMPVYSMFSYDCIEVAILKNKMAKEDMRVLFTEYRQKRKGDFNSTKRRAEDLKSNEQD